MTKLFTQKELTKMTGDSGSIMVSTRIFSKILDSVNKFHNFNKSTKRVDILYRLNKLKLLILTWQDKPDDDKQAVIEKKREALAELQQQVDQLISQYQPSFQVSDADVVPSNAAMYRGTNNNYLKFYNDGSDDAQGNTGAFADIDTAIAQAKEFVFIVDWSFHPKFKMRRRTPDEKSIGEILLDKAHKNPELLVAIMTWRHYSIHSNEAVTGDDDNNDGGNALKKLNGGKDLPSNLLWKAFSQKSSSWSHHQKFVVIDAPVDDSEPDGERCIKVFFGGLDLTKGRFDWSQHPCALNDPLSMPFKDTYDDWYNNEFGDNTQLARQPWHDIHAQLIGSTAWDFVDEFVARWGAGKVYSSACGPMDNKQVYIKLEKLLSGQTSHRQKIFQRHENPVIKVAGEPASKPWKAQLLHSMYRENGWGPSKEISKNSKDKKDFDEVLNRFKWPFEDINYERSIQDAYLKLIEAAEEFIYIESQYLIGSGYLWRDTAYNGSRRSVANRIPEALVERIKKAKQEGKDFHVYIVLPMHPEGAPASKSIKSVRYLQWCTMEYMLKAVYKACGSDWVDYLSFYCLANWSHVFKDADKLLDENGKTDWTKLELYKGSVKKREEKIALSQRYMIYVHSKLMIVDDKYAIIGSANLNERSLNGNRDTEICVALWPGETAVDEAKNQLRQFREKVWEEHLGVNWMDLEIYGAKNRTLNPGSKECAELVAAAGEHNFLNFMRGMRGEGETGHLIRWPVGFKDGKVVFNESYYSKLPNDYIPDYPESGKDVWKWVSGWTFMSQSSLTDELAE